MSLKWNVSPIEKNISSIEGPSVSISIRRGQISFSKEAVELMKIKENESYIQLGYDDNTKTLVFAVSTEEAEFKSKVEKMKTGANNAEYLAILAKSYLLTIPEIHKENSYKYELKQHENYFYIYLNKFKQNPKGKSKGKSKAKSKAE